MTKDITYCDGLNNQLAQVADTQLDKINKILSEPSSISLFHDIVSGDVHNENHKLYMDSSAGKVERRLGLLQKVPPVKLNRISKDKLVLTIAMLVHKDWEHNERAQQYTEAVLLREALAVIYANVLQTGREHALLLVDLEEKLLL